MRLIHFSINISGQTSWSPYNMYIVLIPVIDLINRLINKKHKKNHPLLARWEGGSIVWEEMRGKLVWGRFSIGNISGLLQAERRLLMAFKINNFSCWESILQLPALIFITYASFCFKFVLSLYRKISYLKQNKYLQKKGDSVSLNSMWGDVIGNGVKEGHNGEICRWKDRKIQCFIWFISWERLVEAYIYL